MSVLVQRMFVMLILDGACVRLGAMEWIVSSVTRTLGATSSRKDAKTVTVTPKDH